MRLPGHNYCLILKIDPLVNAIRDWIIGEAMAQEWYNGREALLDEGIARVGEFEIKETSKYLLP